MDDVVVPPGTPDAEQSNIGKHPLDAQPSRPNWSAAERFKEAEDAAEAIRCMDASHKTNRKEAIIGALCLALRLVEDWRGEHRDEIDAFLGKHAPTEKKSTGYKPDEVLAIVKCVFHIEGAKQWTWHANAIRQALAEGKTADDAGAYFKLTPPTTAAEVWSKAHPRPKKPEPTEVPFPSDLPIPYPPPGKEKAFTIRMREDGQPVFLIRSIKVEGAKCQA
jgi:hypothetical protein